MSSIPRLFFVGSILVALLIGATHAQTPPPGHSADWNAGYVAGWNAAVASTQPSPPDLGPTQPIDLAPIVKAAKDGSTVALTKGSTYYLRDLCVIEKSITLDGVGCTLECPASGGTFHPSKAFTKIKNFTVNKCALFIDNWADSLTVEGCIMGKGQPNESIGQFYKSGPGGTNASLINNWVGITKTVTVYIDRNGLNILSCTLEGSTTEYAVRASSPDGTTIPTGLLIDGCKISNKGTASKDTIGLRERKDCKITNSTIYGYVRFGQSGKPTNTPADKYCTAQVISCTFTNPAGRSYINVLQGATVTVTGNIYLYPEGSCIAADGQSMTTMGDNIQQVIEGTKIYPFWSSAYGGVLDDNGGNRVVEVPK